MRQHVFSLRQEMLRRKLQAQADELDATVDEAREELVAKVRRLNTTERFTEFVEGRELLERDRRDQSELDEAGLMVWARNSRGAA